MLASITMCYGHFLLLFNIGDLGVQRYVPRTTCVMGVEGGGLYGTCICETSKVSGRISMYACANV